MSTEPMRALIVEESWNDRYDGAIRSWATPSASALNFEASR